MKVFDFDKTIYSGDSTLDFYFFCLKRKPTIIRFFPKQVMGYLLHTIRKVTTEQFKEAFFCFLPALDHPENIVETFWDKKIERIKPWYLEQSHPDDLVISASPFFLISPACRRLKIAEPIATSMEIATGKIHGANCKGVEKVRRLREQCGSGKIDTFFSDSLSDSPLADIAQHAFIVKGKTILQWPKGSGKKGEKDR